MFLRNGKHYGLEDEWWYKLTKDYCRLNFDPYYSGFCVSSYNKFTVREWLEDILIYS